MNVIILADNHHNALGLVRSAGISGLNVYVILNSISCNFLDKSKYIKKCIYIHDEREILPAILELTKVIERPLLLSSSEEYAAFVDRNVESLSAYCYVEGGKHNNSIQKYRSKTIANKLACEVGFDVPVCFEVDYTNRRNIPTDIKFPLIVKTSNSVPGWKDAMKTCHDLTALKSHIENLDEALFPLVVQQFIEKDYEMLYVGCSLDAGNTVIAPVGHRKIRHYPNINGLGSYSESFYTGDDKDVSKLIEMSRQFLAKIQYTGMFSTEFVVAQGHYYFLETNLRNDATSIISTRCGFNLVSLFCDYISGKKVTINKNDYKPRHYMNIVSDIHHMLNGRISPFKWLWQLITAGAYPYLYVSDIKPSFYYVYYLIKNKFTK